MWAFQRKIVAPDGTAGAYFGMQLTTDAGRVAVGTPGDDSLVKGSVYAFDLGYVTPAETTLTVSAPGVLVNDTMSDLNTVVAFARTTPVHGKIVMQKDSGFTYSPSRKWLGTDTFSYACTDGTSTSNAAAVTIQTWQPTKLMLAASDLTPKYAHAMTLKAVLNTFAGTTIAGRVVRFEMLAGKKWVTVGLATTDRSGIATCRVASVTTGGTYRVRTAFSAVYGAAGSERIRVVPHVLVTEPTVPTSIRLGKEFTAVGSLKPHHKSGSKPVQLYYYLYESGSWVLKQTVWATVKDRSDYSRYSASVSLDLPGQWRVRAYHSADSTGAATWSRFKELTVK
jgi:hypothetical protein